MSDTQTETMDNTTNSIDENTETTQNVEKQKSVTKPKHSNLFVRLLTSAIGVPLIILAIFFLPPHAWAIFIAVAAFLGLLEWITIQAPSESKATIAFSAFLALLPPAALYLFAGDQAPIQQSALPTTLSPWILCAAATAITLWTTFLFNCVRKRNIENVKNLINASLSGTIYVAFTFLFLALFKRDFPQNAPFWILMFMTMTWLSDTGAYFVGRKFGKHKLAPVLSPKKTIEGAMGGFLFAVITAIVFKILAFPNITYPQIILLVVVSNFLSQTGDLAESLIKRSAGVKDSGNLIPGHGGVLDRVDAILFALPWVYLFANFTAHNS